MKSITLKNITHTYGKHTVLHDVTLSLPIGKMIAICGPSVERQRFSILSACWSVRAGEVCSMMKWRFAQTAAER